MKVFETIVHAIFPIVWVLAMVGSIYVIHEEKNAITKDYRLFKSHSNKLNFNRQTKM